MLRSIRYATLLTMTFVILGLPKKYRGQLKPRNVFS